ncbi:MAG: hypothetical protein M3198_09030 [Actinomycetota bacterium]|nr:hypothetical protein [Actinomycetota bacterium]
MDGRVREHPENKTLFYNGFATFAYTGLAKIGATPTDEWLMDRLVSTSNLGVALPALADAATRALRNYDFRGATPANRRVWRRLGIVSAGFVGLKEPEKHGRHAVADHAHPFLSVVSNFYDPLETWKRESEVRFTHTFQFLPENDDMILLAAGKPLSQPDVTELKRSLRRSLAHSNSAWPAARLLARHVRAVWRRDRKGPVGPNVMCMLLPRPRNPNQFSFSGSPFPLQDTRLTELQVFSRHSAAWPGEPDIEKHFIYWPYDSTAFRYYFPNIVTSDGRCLKGGRVGPVDVIDREVPETTPIPPWEPRQRPPLP